MDAIPGTRRFYAVSSVQPARLVVPVLPPTVSQHQRHLCGTEGRGLFVVALAAALRNAESEAVGSMLPGASLPSNSAAVPSTAAERQRSLPGHNSNEDHAAGTDWASYGLQIPDSSVEYAFGNQNCQSNVASSAGVAALTQQSKPVAAGRTTLLGKTCSHSATAGPSTASQLNPVAPQHDSYRTFEAKATGRAGAQGQPVPGKQHVPNVEIAPREMLECRLFKHVSSLRSASTLSEVLQLYQAGKQKHTCTVAVTTALYALTLRIQKDGWGSSQNGRDGAFPGQDGEPHAAVSSAIASAVRSSRSKAPAAEGKQASIYQTTGAAANELLAAAYRHVCTGSSKPRASIGASSSAEASEAAGFTLEQMCLLLWCTCHLKEHGLVTVAAGDTSQYSVLLAHLAGQLAEGLRGRPGAIAHNHASMALWASVRLGLWSSEGQQDDQAVVPTPQLARPLGDSIIYHAPQMGPRDLSNALWSIAAASAASMAVKGEAPAKLQQQQQQQRSRSALSNHSTVKLVSVLCTALEADGMAYANGQDVANVLWALAKLRVMPSALLMRVLQNALIRTARSLRPQEVANAMWGLASILGSGKAGNKDPAISLPSSAATISSRPSDDERWQFSSMTRGSVIQPASAMHVQSHAPCFSALRTRAVEVGAQLQAGHWAQLLWAHAHCPAARLQPAAAVPSTSQQRSASVPELLESAGRYLHVLLGHEGCVSVHEAATLAWALGTLRSAPPGLLPALLAHAARVPQAVLQAQPASAAVLLLWGAAWVCVNGQASTWHVPPAHVDAQSAVAQDAAARLGHDLGMSVEQPSQASAAGLLAVEQKQAACALAALGNAAGQGAVKQGQVTEQQVAQASFVKLAGSLAGRVHTLSPELLSMLLWALARAGYHTLPAPPQQRASLLTSCTLACRLMLGEEKRQKGGARKTFTLLPGSAAESGQQAGSGAASQGKPHHTRGAGAKWGKHSEGGAGKARQAHAQSIRSGTAAPWVPRLGPHQAACAVWALAVLQVPCAELLDDVAQTLTKPRGQPRLPAAYTRLNLLAKRTTMLKHPASSPPAHPQRWTASTRSTNPPLPLRVKKARWRSGRRWVLTNVTGHGRRWCLADKLTPQDVGKLMWAYAASGHVHEHLYFTCAVRVLRLVAASMRLLAAAAAPPMAAASGTFTVNSSSSSSSGRNSSMPASVSGQALGPRDSVRVYGSKLPRWRVASMAQRLSLGPGSVCQLLWAFTMVGYQDEQLAEALCARALELRGLLQARDIAALAWALGSTAGGTQAAPSGPISGSSAEQPVLRQPHAAEPATGGWIPGSGSAADMLLRYCIDHAAHASTSMRAAASVSAVPASGGNNRVRGGSSSSSRAAAMHFSPSQLSVTAWAAAMAGCYISSTPVLLTNAAALLPQSYYEGKGARASSFGNSSSSSDHMCGDAVWTLEDAARLAWSHAALRVFDPKLLAAVDRVVPGELRKQSCHPAGADPNLVSMLLMAHASWMQYDAGLYRASALALEPVLESLPVEELVTIAWCFSMGLLRHARKEAYKASTVTFTTAAAAVAVTQPGADKAEHQQQSMLACRAILQHISSLLAGLRPDVLIRRELRQLAQAFTAATEASALLNEAATQANSIGTTLQRTPSAAAAVPAMSAAAGSSSSPLRLSPALHMAAFSAWSAVGGAKNLGRRRAVVELADALCNLGCLHVSMDGRCSHSGVPIDVVATQPGGKVADRSADAAAGSLAAASAATVRAGEKGSKQQARGKAGKGGKDDSAEEHEGEELGLSMMAKKNRSHATLRAAPETMVETADGGQLRLSANGSGGMVVQRVVRYAVLLCTDDQLSRYPAANSAGAAPRAATVLRAAALQRGGWVVVLVGQGWWLSYASREQQRAALAGLLAAARAAPRQTAAAGAAGQAVMRML